MKLLVRLCGSLKHNGFTLVEVLFALIVTTITALIINLTMPLVVHGVGSHSDNLTAFHLFLKEVEDPAHNFQIKEVAKRTVVLVDSKQNKVYYIEKFGDKLRMTTSKGGYLPLLDTITEFEPLSIEKGTKFIVKFKSGEIYEGDVTLPNYQDAQSAPK